ncbi:MAG: hypothetical protein N3D14_00790 [Aquificaceae bacterium]|nr:hypothetical protein [Aquificaceae bacterium]
MLPALKAFFDVTRRYTDLRWAKTRDDLISKSIKVLKALKEGRSVEEIKSLKELSFEIEDMVEYMHNFVKENPREVERLIELLGMFIKSPAPCKIRLISFAEVLLEDRRAPQKGSV